MPRLFMNTYDPLVATLAGREACARLSIPPFVDGSIRREPDLEHQFPSITCICRLGKFAPRLLIDDTVVYMTKKARYGSKVTHRRLTGVLKVIRLFDTHTDAAEWYQSRALGLPSNCLVPGNPPHHVSESHGRNQFRHSDPERWGRRWDCAYQRRAKSYGRFVICEPLWRDVSWNSPVVHDPDLVAVFHRVPGTRNPGMLPPSRLRDLMSQLKVPWPPRTH